MACPRAESSIFYFNSPATDADIEVNNLHVLEKVTSTKKPFEVYIFDITTHSVFFQWWETTLWRREYLTSDALLPILPERRNSAAQDIFLKSRASRVWQSFTPCADLLEGKPWVMYTTCNKILAHPYQSFTIKRSQGTSSLLRHIGSKACSKAIETEPLEEDNLAEEATLSVCIHCLSASFY